MLKNHFNAADGVANPRLQDLLGQLFFVEGDYFLDVAHAAAQVFSQPDDLANDDRRTRDCLHHAQLPALDALGDFNLALAGKQGNGTHLAQIHAHRVVGLLERAGGQVELDVFRLLAGLGLVLLAAFAAIRAQLNTLGADGCHQVVEVVHGHDAVGQQVVDLAEGHITLLFANLYNVVFVLIQFFGHDSAHSLTKFVVSG